MLTVYFVFILGARMLAGKLEDHIESPSRDNWAPLSHFLVVTWCISHSDRDAGCAKLPCLRDTDSSHHYSLGPGRHFVNATTYATANLSLLPGLRRSVDRVGHLALAYVPVRTVTVRSSMVKPPL